MVAYFISGLGADRHIFKHLKLPPEYGIVHIDWIEPMRNEPLKDYCRRLASVIDPPENFILIGMSFGGMVATEIAQILSPWRTVIISSASSSNELPWYFRLAGHLKLYALSTPFLLKAPLFFLYWIFGAKTKSEKALLQQYLQHTSPNYLQWSIKNILTWERIIKPENILHIHGAADRVLPARFTKADIIVEGGGHLMVYNMAAKISSLIAEYLSKGQQST